MLEKLAFIDRFHLGRLKRFMQFLKSTADGEHSMLDKTIVVFGSGMNSGEGGDHSPKNLPLLIAGGHGLGLKHGKHIKFSVDQNPPLSNLWLELAQRMGIEKEGFSDSTSTMSEVREA
jgi:hypothetical protein